MRQKLTKILSLALMLATLAMLITSCNLPLWNMESPFAEISEAGTLQPEGTPLSDPGDCDTTGEYLIAWGMHAFRPTKLDMIERYYEEYYVDRLPSTFDRATAVYDAYREAVRGLDPLYLDADTVTAYLISLFQKAVGDKYAVYMDESYFASFMTESTAEYVGIGVYTHYSEESGTLTVSDVFDDSPAKEAGVVAGDLLVAVNGTYLASVGYDAFFTLLTGAHATVHLTVERDGEEITYTLVPRKINITSVFYETVAYASKTYARIRVTEFSQKTDEQFKRAVDRAESEGVSGILFDLRDNPGGSVDTVVAMLDYLLPDGGKLAHFRYREGSAFEDASETYYAKDGHSVDLPCVVLCNGSTASAGELFTATLSDYDYATVVGTKTYGKGMAQNLISLADGTGFTISTAYYDPAYGANYEGKGITPDRTVSLTEGTEGIPLSLRTPDNDVQMSAALTALSMLTVK